MTIVTESEIERYRLQLAEYPDALKALDVLEDCEGDLEYAAETIAIVSGELKNDLAEKDPNQPSLLHKQFERLRPHICTQAFKDVLNQGSGAALGWLITAAIYSALPLTLILIYISTRALDEFCKDC
ncbi:hypothetical protein QUA71_19825 [Microcoleus sp. MON1_C5]|uniref:hypothetical protein n=1 Tax=Microcoleus sp. MON1_C5 TaxID=2818828 RepID=UPI002FD5ED1A